MKDLSSAVLAVAICELAGLVGAIFTMPAIDSWYAGLERSTLNPPSWVFAPVWTTLFFLMGISLFLVWRRRSSRPGVRPALMLFGAQLALNILWSYLFFGMRSPFWAFVEIFALWSAILLTLILFIRISRAAGILLIPYLAWVSFAIYLNYSVWALNRF